MKVNRKKIKTNFFYRSQCLKIFRKSHFWKIDLNAKLVFGQTLLLKENKWDFFYWFSNNVLQAFLSQVHPISTKRESIRVSHLLLLFCWSVPSKFVDLDTESFCSAKVFSPTRTFPSVKWGPSNLPSLQSLVKSCTGFIGSRHWLYPHLKYKYNTFWNCLLLEV